MAVSLKHAGDDDLVEVSDINVTPFIDVVLVLLITFMIAAPLSTVDVSVDLPVSNAQAQPRPDKPVFLSIKNDLSISLGDDPLPREQLQSALDDKTSHNRDQRIFLRADKTVAYGEIMKIMNLLRDAGYLKIALVGLEDVSPARQPAGHEAPAAP
jgi:biopolymer transport protein ExbD